MAKVKNIIAVLTENRIQLIITVFSVAIALINFLIAYRLFPLAQDVAINRIGISANANAVEVLKMDLSVRLDRMEDKLDRLIER